MTAYRSRDCFDHETTLSLYRFQEGNEVGDIDVKITFEVTNWGRPATGPSYSSGGEPAEGPEVDMVHVLMQNAPMSGSKPSYIEAWDWVHEMAGQWVDDHADELAAVASLEMEGRSDAAADARHERDREDHLAEQGK